MDWIEQWFGLAPDNGDGSVELLIMLTVAVVVAVAVVWIVPSFRARAVHVFAKLYARRLAGASLTRQPSNAAPTP
jgi:hypothetical protein